MPSKSKAQRNFMAAVAHNPAFAKKAGVPQSVGKDFNEADKGRKFARGGDTMATKDSEFDDDVATVKRALYKQPGDATLYSRERGLKPGMARRRLDERGVDVRALAANEANPEDLGSYKKGGKVKHEDVKMDKTMMQKAVNKHEGRLHKGASMTKLNMGGMAYAKGGTASARGDGIAQRGKTKGMQVKMRGGGAC